MAGIFDSITITIITVTMFVVGMVGVIVYERTRSNEADKSNS